MSLEREADRESGRLRLVLATANQHKVDHSALAAERAERDLGVGAGGGLPAQGQVGRVEEAALGQEGVQRGGLRVVTPKVVTPGLAAKVVTPGLAAKVVIPGLAVDAGADPAQELSAHWAELLELRAGVQRLQLVADRDPAQRIAEEHRFAGDLRVVART